MMPRILSEIEAEDNFRNIDIHIDTKSLIKDNIYVVMSEDFTGFIYIENNKENYITFNSSILKYAFEEGFGIDNIYKCFEKKLFSFLTKEEFLKKILK
jgi:hypothetical protein